MRTWLDMYEKCFEGAPNLCAIACPGHIPLGASQNSVRECRGKVQAKLCSGESGRGSDTSGTFAISDKRCFDQAIRHALKDTGCI